MPDFNISPLAPENLSKFSEKKHPNTVTVNDNTNTDSIKLAKISLTTLSSFAPIALDKIEDEPTPTSTAIQLFYKSKWRRYAYSS